MKRNWQQSNAKDKHPLPDHKIVAAQESRVRAPARLHLGFLDPDGALGRRFGSVGLAISGPATEIKIVPTDKTMVSGPEQQRAQNLLARFQSALDIQGHYKVVVKSAIPAHAGLGSGTQLALALGAGLQSIAGQTVIPDDLGAIVSRGARSAIGIASFETGGFIIDGGKRDPERPPPVIARAELPDHWRIVLALDTRAQGIHGKREREAFSKLEPLSEATAAHLCHITMMQMLPALHEQNLETFGAAVSEMQAIIGGYFAPAQGGSAFLSPEIKQIVEKMGRLGGRGLGQSSWGPTGFAFLESPDAAERLYTTLVEEAKASGLDLMVVSGRNIGAQINRS